MGFGEALQGATDVTRKYQLSKEMTIEEVFALIEKAGLDPAVTGKITLKKGLFGKSIDFHGDTAAHGVLKVKGTQAKLQKVMIGGKKVGSGFSVGGVPVGANPAGVLDQQKAENAFFSGLGDALKEVLK